MKAYSFIVTKSFLSFLAVFFVISFIDIAFNFFSQLEDISGKYNYYDAAIFVLASEPFRMREFIYLSAVVGILMTFADKDFLRAFNVLRQAGFRRVYFGLLFFLPVVLINLFSYEFAIPDLTKKTFAERKVKVETSQASPSTLIEIKKIDQDNIQISSNNTVIEFSKSGTVNVSEIELSQFENINYNSNLKYLKLSELAENADTSFENFNLLVQTEMLRRALNFVAYFFILLIGIELLIRGQKGFNTNRILIYGFGTCLFYSFVETLVADSITVFGLPFYIQAFPILFMPIYFYLKRNVFF